LVTLTPAPLWVGEPFQSWLMTCPFANDHRSVQPLIAVAPWLLIVIAAWNPPDHYPVMV
jgi:hypothetical protein